MLMPLAFCIAWTVTPLLPPSETAPCKSKSRPTRAMVLPFDPTDTVLEALMVSVPLVVPPELRVTPVEPKTSVFTAIFPFAAELVLRSKVPPVAVALFMRVTFPAFWTVIFPALDLRSRFAAMVLTAVPPLVIPVAASIRMVVPVIVLLAVWLIAPEVDVISTLLVPAVMLLRRLTEPPLMLIGELVPVMVSIFAVPVTFTVSDLFPSVIVFEFWSKFPL